MERWQPDGYNEWPTVRQATRYLYRGDVLYRQNRGATGDALYSVAGFTENPENLLKHDAFIYNGKILESQFSEQYQTVDGYHYKSGRQASLNAHRDLDESIVELDSISPMEDD